METIRGRDPISGKVLEITFEGGVITGMGQAARESEVWLAAGLVDLQVNGYGGIDLNSEACTVDDVRALTRRLAGLGTTTFLPTIVTASLEETAARLRTIVEARDVDAMVRHAVVGVHLEGPHISPVEGYVGAHAMEHVRPPSWDEFEELQMACGGLIALVTLSPHWAGTREFVRALTERGVAVSLGHTHATQEQIAAAVDAGARMSTHLGNGIAAELPRHPNPLWSQLAEDRLSACFIADGAHLPGEVMRAMMRAKGLERCVLVSDSVALAGSAAGEYSAAVGGDVVVGEDGSIRLRGSRLLAGSGIVLKDAVARAVGLADLSLGAAVTMATGNAGVFAGSRGVLRVGASADFFTFDWSPGDRTLDIREVFLAGRSVRHEFDNEE